MPDSGELLIFGSYLAHRSGANNSNSDRKAIYATYNCKSEGDLHDAYSVLLIVLLFNEYGNKYHTSLLKYVLFNTPI